METYNTYQEAKIANTDSGIFQSVCNGFFTTKEWIDKNNNGRFLFAKCDPANHCITVEKFLAGGHEFIDGDVFIDSDGEIESVGGRFYKPSGANRPHEDDNKRYVLRAAALEEKKPRTKVEYVKCNYGNEHYAAGCDLFTCKPLFVLSKDGNYYPIKRQDKAVKASQDGRIYERIETPITERDEFIEAAGEALPSFDKRTAPIWAGKLYDSGKFKLVK